MLIKIENKIGLSKEMKRDIEIARKRIKRGNFYTEEEAKKILDL